MGDAYAIYLSAFGIAECKARRALLTASDVLNISATSASRVTLKGAFSC